MRGENYEGGRGDNRQGRNLDEGEVVLWTRGNLSLVCVCCACSIERTHARTDYPTSEMAEEEGEFIKT